MSDLESRVLDKTWFYRFTLPSGRVTETYDGGALDLIHTTRRQMLDAALDAEWGGRFEGLRAVDLACHQGWFSAHLARRGFAEVQAVDAREEHVADASLIRHALGLDTMTVSQGDVHALPLQAMGTFDLCLCFGLIYHLENPVGALRVARALTRRLCLIETQVVPGLTGWVDYGRNSRRVQMGQSGHRRSHRRSAKARFL